MQNKTFLSLALLIVTISAARLDYNSKACDVFTAKFGTTNSADGKGPTSLNFGGEVSIEDGTSNVKVKIHYADPKFLNTTFYGLVQEDGQTAENTCLDLRIYKYTNQNYSDPTQVKDLQITHDKWDQKSYRYYIINFQGDQFDDRLIRTESQNYYVYTGYYGFAYYLQSTDNVQYTHLFQFTIRLNRNTKQIVNTGFYPISDESGFKCAATGKCDIDPISSLKFCTDSACTAFTTNPNIHINDNIFLLHEVTTPGLQKYVLSNSTITLESSGLQKPIDHEVSPVYRAGNASYVIKAPIAWPNLNIVAQTVLVSTKTNRRILSTSNLRLLADDTIVPTEITQSAQGITTETCVKVSGSENCPSCAEMCVANKGDAPAMCACTEKPCDNPSECFSHLILASVMLIMLLMF